MGIIEKIKVLEQAKSLIFCKTEITIPELEELTLPEIVEYLKEIEDPDSKFLLNCISQIDSEPGANYYTNSEIGCIRLFDDQGKFILFRNYVGDCENRIYIIGKEENTENLYYIATISGEWYISGSDTENEEEGRINGVFDVYTDKNSNFFFKEINDNDKSKV